MAARDLRRVERAAREVDRAKEALREAVIQAHETGETQEDIGLAAGLSRQRVGQLVRGEGRREQ